jgi:hypothetical protein
MEVGTAKADTTSNLFIRGLSTRNPFIRSPYILNLSIILSPALSILNRVTSRPIIAGLERAYPSTLAPVGFMATIEDLEIEDLEIEASGTDISLRPSVFGIIAEENAATMSAAADTTRS